MPDGYEYSPKSWFPYTAQWMPQALRIGTICFPFVTVLTEIIMKTPQNKATYVLYRSR